MTVKSGAQAAAAGTPAAPRRLVEMDALRCFAMTAVVAQHSGILPFGWIGVWLFYVLSGFVVTGSLVEHERDGGRGEQLSGFYRRRSVRILPIYFGYVILGFFVSAAQSPSPEVGTLASLLLFYNNIGMSMWNMQFAHWPTGHLWTLSVEMQFYLFYGAAFIFLARRHLKAALIACLVASPILRLVASGWLTDAGFDPLSAAYAIYSGPVLHFDTFALGALLALHTRSGAEAPPKFLFPLGVAAFALHAGVYVAVNILVRGDHGIDALRNVVSGILYGEGREVVGYCAIGLACVGVVALALRSTGLLRAFLSWRPLVEIGRISYGGYVYHVLFVGFAAQIVARWVHLDPALAATIPGKLVIGLATFALAYPATLLTAWLSFRFIERPLLRRAARAEARPAQPAAATEPVSS